MSHARRIESRDELGEIHRDGQGYVFYPFGRKVHRAQCMTVPRMALNPKEARWFAPSDEAARAYQLERLAANPTARRFETVRCCGVFIPAHAIVTGEDTSTVPLPSPRAL